jgi:anti-sigma factor RsiW
MSTSAHVVGSEEVMALLDGELSTDRAQSVAAHIEDCADCGGLASALRSDSRALSSWSVPVLPANPQLEASLVDAARRAWSQPPSAAMQVRAFLRRHWLLTAAASALTPLLAFTLSTGSFGPMVNMAIRPRSVQKAVKEIAEGGDSGANGYHRWLEQPAVDQLSTDGSLTTRTAPGVAGPGEQAETPPGVTVTSNALRSQPLPDQQAQPLAGPMIARSVSLSIVMKQFDAARSSVDAILARHNGYAASLTVDTPQNAPRSLQASLRIPATELNAAAAELKAIGNVLNETQNGEEVSQQHADLVARLKNSREAERRLQMILEQRTGKISDVLAVEQEIARVRGEIEQMEAQQKSLEHRVDFATIDLTLAEEYKAKIGSASPAIATRLHNALVSGYRNAIEALVGIVLFFAANGPSFVLWLILLLPVAWLLRRRWLRANAVASSLGA